MTTITLSGPYLLFIGGAADALYAKTALGLRDWIPDQCIGELGLPGAPALTGLPRMSAAEAHRNGARSIVIGVAAPGGGLPPAWIDCLLVALEARF